MISPYFEADGITLYHGDCREITVWLEADVLVTDPPYGMAYVSNSSKYGATKPIAGDGDAGIRDEVLAMWGTRPALIFGTWRVPRPAQAKALLVWDKGDSPGMGDLKLPWGPSHEEVYVLGDGFTGQRGPSVVRFPTLPPSASWRPDHPTPKPVALMESLIAKCPAGVIAEPFAGSGATLLAARAQGRKAIAVELDEAYCDLIATRLAQGDLFGGAA